MIKCYKTTANGTLLSNVFGNSALLLLALIVALCLCSCGKNKAETKEGGGFETPGGLVLDATISDGLSAEEAEATLNSFDVSGVTSAFVFMNAGTSTGQYFILDRAEQEELLNGMIDDLFAPGRQYTLTQREYEYGPTAYSSYVTFSFAGDKPDVTVFRSGIDATVIRFQGMLFESESLQRKGLDKAYNYCIGHDLIKQYVPE